MAGTDSETQLANAQPPSAPEPRLDRYRWTRRGLILAGCLVLLLAGLRWWWGYEANRRLQAEIAKCRAAGQFVYARDFDAELEAVPDAENAAVLYEQAMNTMTWTSPSGVSVDDFYNDAATFQKKPADAAALIEANRTALNLVRQARQRPQVAWSERLVGLYGPRYPSLPSSQRALARLLRVSAEYHCRTGDVQEAIQTTHDLVVYSDAVASFPTVLANLAGHLAHTMAFNLVENVGVLHNHENALDFTASLAYPTGRCEMEGLLSALLDESRLSATAVSVFLGERAYVLDSFLPGSGYVSGTAFGTTTPLSSAWQRIEFFATRPLLVLDTIRQMQQCTAAAYAVQAESWPVAEKRLRPSDVSRTFLRLFSRPITIRLFVDSAFTTRHYVETHYTYFARRRIAAVAVAIRLFELDHGRRPDSLDELVPRYLPAVPLDPFAPDGAAIRYRPDATPALLYSVGVDGTDNMGERVIRDDKRVDATCSDISFRLGE
ncbi:MAG: hypothetical protein JXB13_07780 [Phycisphaerae bacterium]|nr:hypothetical protein [Phycisphaerae bacterium]